MPSSGPDLLGLAVQGAELSLVEARALEAEVRRSPDDAENRARLVGYHAVRSHGRRKSTARRRHALWFIEHRPADAFTGSPLVSLRRALDPEGYRAASRLWLRHVRGTTPVQVLANAAYALGHESPKLAQTLLRRAALAEPRNPQWQSDLGHHFLRQALRARGAARRRLARAALGHLERKQRLTRGQPFRWYNLTDLAWASYQAGLTPRAKRYALQMLRLAERFPNDWNHGNALHHGHTILGLLALQKAHIAAACTHLLEAGATPGSPQLNSFGPSMDLARALLREGEQETVLEYLERCKRFWALAGGSLGRWGNYIRRRGTSDLQ